MSTKETSKTDNSDIAEMSFETALAELEQIVGRLEHGDVPLAESIQIYERGEALRAHSDKLLAKAEAKVEKLTLSPEGTPSQTSPLEIE